MQRNQERIVINTIIVGQAVFTVYMEQTGTIGNAGMPQISVPAPAHTPVQKQRQTPIQSQQKHRTNDDVKWTRWTDEDEKKLIALLQSNVRPVEAAKILHRTNAAVWARSSILRQRGVELPTYSNNPAGPHGKKRVAQQA